MPGAQGRARSARAHRTIKEHGAETVVHTAGLIGGRVQQSLTAAFDINLGGTRNVAEAVRLDRGEAARPHLDVRRLRPAPRGRNAPVAEDFPRGGARAYGEFKAAKEMILRPTPPPTSSS